MQIGERFDCVEVFGFVSLRQFENTSCIFYLNIGLKVMRDVIFFYFCFFYIENN